ncbi:uncharacterized protein VICG_01408 [Vittaforma corneae ATCC 50505]|uniref:Uncharacterized protein n=1 Tax=Vittaforma corneae (strain ATCC 50505) TaxID=993615 RepID=L2GLN1_VITCO|nr:uncharacterized protein VICG_01408 [Vittaforma corneae ATCC 50505]ELA41544.1 hypothetical protein VICG_01408 [Vittaforma corneae ATCC 50505]
MIADQCSETTTNQVRCWYAEAKDIFSAIFNSRYGQEQTLFNEAARYFKLDIQNKATKKLTLYEQIRDMFLSTSINSELRRKLGMLGIRSWQIYFIFDNWLFPFFGSYWRIIVLAIMIVLFYFNRYFVVKSTVPFFIVNLLCLYFAIVSMFTSEAYMAAIFRFSISPTNNQNSSYDEVDYFMRLQTIEWVILSIFIATTCMFILFFHVISDGESQPYNNFKYTVMRCMVVIFVLFYLVCDVLFSTVQDYVIVRAFGLHVLNGLLCYLYAFGFISYVLIYFTRIFLDEEGI